MLLFIAFNLRLVLTYLLNQVEYYWIILVALRAKVLPQNLHNTKQKLATIL